MEIKDTSKRIEKINWLIPDKNTRNIIFNFDDEYDGFMEDNDQFLHYFNNILILASNIALHAFLKWKNIDQSLSEVNKTNYSNSLYRIYNLLDRVYDPLKFNISFISDFIVDLNIDYLLDQEDSKSFVEATGLASFFNFNRKNNKLSKYVYFLQKKKCSDRYRCKEFGFEQLCECINMFAFLHNCRVNFKETQIEEIYTKTVVVDVSDISGSLFDEVDLQYSICVVNNREVYYVEDYEFFDPRKLSQNKDKNQVLTLNYISLNGTENFKLHISDFKIDLVKKCREDEYCLCGDTLVEDFILDYDIVNSSSKESDSIFFRDYILLNNKYIKEIALTITDSLSVKAKQYIKKTYEVKYRGIFEAMYITSLYNKKDVVSYRWDEIVLFLLLEEGIHDFLKFLLQYETFETLLLSFHRRYGRETINSICQSEPFILNHSDKIQYLTSSVNGLRDCQAKAIVLLASKLLTMNEWNLEKSYYPTTIDDIINEVDRIYFEKQYNENEKLLNFANIVIRTLFFINDFYCGIFKYYRCKKNSILQLESNGLSYAACKAYGKEKESWISQISDEIKSDKRNKYMDSFVSSKKAYNKAASKDIIQKVETVFSVLINANRKFSGRKNANNEILFDTLGRRSIFDETSMNNFKSKIISVFENSHRNSVQELYLVVKSFLFFLKTGVATDNKCIVNETYSLENAIYPIVGQYYCGVTSRDGYRYSFFKVDTVSADKSSHSVNIKVISDDEFDFGYSYYCVPNINRIASFDGNDAADYIWVSPIIIPCSIFLIPMATQIESLEKCEDYDSVVELIYESDNNVYEKLFGSLDNAKLVMPILFDNSNSKFSKNHYYIIKKQEQVVAVAALYKSTDFKWDTDNIRIAFEDAGVELPETFEEAVNYLKEIFDDCIGASFCLVDDLCVKEEFRNRGIGKSLVMYLSKKAESENLSVVLSVYNENNVAFDLYSSVGFIPYAEVSIAEDCSKNYIKMIKK